MILIEDFRRFKKYLGLSGITSLKLIFMRYTYVIILIRIQSGSLFWLLPLRVISKILLSMIYNIEVASPCTIGVGLILPHPRNIVIGARSIGEDCLIMANVTLGAKVADPHFTEELRPALGNHVVIGVGACILGGINISDFSSIGANAVVTKTVARGQTIVGSNRLV
jgi:serine O-acetyltransferase